MAVLQFAEAGGRLATAALESALQALDSPVVILDASGRIVWLNAAGERLSSTIRSRTWVVGENRSPPSRPCCSTKTRPRAWF